MTDYRRLAVGGGGREGFSASSLQRMVADGVRSTQRGDIPNVEALLAALIKTTIPANAVYYAIPYTVTSGNYRQILPEDDARVALVLTTPNLAVTTALPSYLLEQGPTQTTVIPSDVVARSFVAPQNMQIILTPAPTNAICVLAASGADATGVIFCASARD